MTTIPPDLRAVRRFDVPRQDGLTHRWASRTGRARFAGARARGTLVVAGRVEALRRRAATRCRRSSRSTSPSPTSDFVVHRRAVGLRQEHAAQHRRRLRDADGRAARRSTAGRDRAPGPERGVVFQQGALFTWMTRRWTTSRSARARSASAAPRRATIAAQLHRTRRPAPASRVAIRTSSRAACSSASASPVRWPTSPRCC